MTEDFLLCGKLARSYLAGCVSDRLGNNNGTWVIIIIIIIVINVFSCNRPFLPGTFLKPAVIPTAQASSFTLQYFPYYM
jgi:nitrate/nitrite transporter NarK